MIGKGRKVMTRILRQALAPPGELEQRMLRLTGPQQVVQIRRLMYIDDHIRLLVDMSFPADLVSGFENVNIINSQSFPFRFLLGFLLLTEPDLTHYK